MEENCDVLIIGGGPSGSIAACKLLKAGFSVTILEKLEFPRFVIGESLLPKCNEVLESIGILDVIKEQGFMLKPGAIFIDENKIEEIIDFRDNLGQKCNTSFQVKREEFDNVLLQTAIKLGADVRHKVEVIDYDNEKNIIYAQNEDGVKSSFKARFVLDASGYGRVLPQLLNLDEPSDLKLRNAILTRMTGETRRDKENEGFIDIVIHDDNKAWFWGIPFSDGVTSIGIVCEENYFLDTGLSKEEFLLKAINSHKYLKEKYKNAKQVAPVRIINGYSASIKKMYGKGFAMSGNATEFLDPVFSSGVTLALESSSRVASLIIDELNGKEVDWQKDYEDYMMMGINVFREFVYAWYSGKLRKIFYAKNKSKQIKQSIASILSGYVWDENNYFVKNTKQRIDALVEMSESKLMNFKNRVFVNYFDTISCAGDNANELFSSICEKKDTITLDTNYVKDRVVAIGKIKKDKSLNDILLERLKELLKNLNLKDFQDTLLVVGSSVGGMSETENLYFKDKNYKNIDYKKHPIDSIAYFLKKQFTFYDDISFSTACTSSANALGYAKEVIQKGIYKNVLVVGIDDLSYTTVCGFSALSVLSSKPCTPFDKNREGMNVAEGFGILFLQDKKQDSSIEILGVGYSSDAHHMTQPHPNGLGAIEAMKNALKDAKLKPDDIDYINAHGTGTYANDFSELTAIKELFKDSKIKPQVSSTKSITGHTLGAAGAIEAIICCMVLKNQTIVPNKGLNEIEIDGINYPMVTSKQDIKYTISNSFAFGGNNTSLIFGLCNED